MLALAALIMALSSAVTALRAQEQIRILHLGDQETWLLSAQGNLRDTPPSTTPGPVADAFQILSYYGGIDRMATLIANRESDALLNNRHVIKLNAGDAILPGPRLKASFVNLSGSYMGGQDFYDAIALRQIDFDAITFGNHEFDLGPKVAADFVKASETDYLSLNLDFTNAPDFAPLVGSNQVKPSKIITTGSGNRVAIIGLTTPLNPVITSLTGTSGTVAMGAGYNAANTEAQNLDALVPFLQAEINNVRTTGSANIVILMSHLQNASNELALVPKISGLDLVISGGGHELMVNGTTPSDPIIATASSGIAPTYTNYPLIVTDTTGKNVPVVTGHFGNRYIGELDATISGTTLTVTNSRMLRVSGRLNPLINLSSTFAAEPDAVAGDSTLNTSVVQPVLAYLNVLNSTAVGQRSVSLNGARGAVGTSVPAITPGVRNSDTNLGNLMADALRFAGEADVALQNGGGIRASISGTNPDTNITVGNTFDVAPFTNLVKTASGVNGTQIKAILEHGFAATTGTGTPQGRFPQISGMRVQYTTASGSGSRVQNITLDDGRILVDGGVVTATGSTASVRFATIDFLANGGDGYPFASNGYVFENATFSITYQEALAEYIQTEKTAGGLGRTANPADGPEVTINAYGPISGTPNFQDFHGRIVNLAWASPTPGSAFNGTSAPNTIVGTTGDDTIFGGNGADNLTGNAGGDVFDYNSVREAGDIINDFTPAEDKIDLAGLLTSLGINPATAFANGNIRVVDVTGGVSIQYDTDGTAGPLLPRHYITLKGVVAHQVVPADFILQ